MTQFSAPFRRAAALTLLLAAASPGCNTDATDRSSSAGRPPADVPEGPAFGCTPFPATVAVAVLDEAIGPSAEVSHVVAFYKSGSLRAISDVSCTPSGSTNTSGSACGQDFDCGGCTVMFAHGDALPMQGIDEWWRLASNDPKPECARFHAAYLLVDPADAASGGGASGDGTVPGNGGGDACDACLEACQGLSSCCTGTGCECEGACAPVGCVAGLTLCCGPGSCICTASCPY